MMPRPTAPHARICRDCHGFGRAHIATGLTRPDGTRDTTGVNCQTCHGLGTVARPVALVGSRA
ncbi:hypothetical protein [Kitasatospora sp. NPDC002040]|uniref:hypothetical protein n=1 Tax=Kitasatospora sp. NPDC002040 TaxID=3154661 RepID=UPI0033334DC3